MIRPQVVAHRGSSATHPENSWAAFEAAVADGADAIECDVQSTRDGALVIWHDLAVENRLLAEVTVAEFEAIEPKRSLSCDTSWTGMQPKQRHRNWRRATVRQRRMRDTRESRSGFAMTVSSERRNMKADNGGRGSRRTFQQRGERPR